MTSSSDLREEGCYEVTIGDYCSPGPIEGTGVILYRGFTSVVKE